MVDIRQSIQYANYLKREGWIIERIDRVNYFIRKFPILGSFMKVQRPEKINFNTIDILCRKYRVFQVVLEPNLSISGGFSAIHKSIIDDGYKLSKSPYLPSKTLQLDLSLPMNRLIDSMKKDARQAIRRGDTKLIHEYSSPNEIKKWREGWKASVNYKRYVPGETQLINLKKSFPQSHSLFLASHNISGRIIGGALFTTSSHGVSNYITYYWYAYTNHEGRTSLSQYSLLYQGILWAIKMGCKTFDFEGIYDERFPNRSWLGFTHFKKSFGGTEVLYPGCYTKFRLL
jgi:lipid II:glycine glycyltransferase (peptidoglycan interpeptide bridge formation enzyme)